MPKGNEVCATCGPRANAHATPSRLVGLVMLLGAAVFAVGCKKDAPKQEPARPVPVAVAEPAPKPLPWYAGHWTGTYQASLFKIEMTEAEGAVKEWAKDDPSSFTGTGTLELSVSEDHRVSGKADGPLGSLVANGEVDEETLRVSLQPTAPVPADQVTSATLIATRKGDAFEGQLRASTGNSLKARVATVTLAKQSGSSQGTAAPGKT